MGLNISFGAAVVREHSVQCHIPTMNGSRSVLLLRLFLSAADAARATH